MIGWAFYWGTSILYPIGFLFSWWYMTKSLCVGYKKNYPRLELNVGDIGMMCLLAFWMSLVWPLVLPVRYGLLKMQEQLAAPDKPKIKEKSIAELERDIQRMERELGIR